MMNLEKLEEHSPITSDLTDSKHQVSETLLTVCPLVNNTSNCYKKQPLPNCMNVISIMLTYSRDVYLQTLPAPFVS
jgi:hypothetical protein